MKITLSPDLQSVLLTAGDQSISLTGPDLRQILRDMPALHDAGLRIPMTLAHDEPDRFLRATAVLRTPNGASTNPLEVGAGLLVHSSLHGHFAVSLTPKDCQHWGEWLLGRHPMQLPPPDTPLN